jgi:hypothetical protein
MASPIGLTARAVKGRMVFHVKQSLPDAESAEQRLEHVFRCRLTCEAIESSSCHAQVLGNDKRIANFLGSGESVRRQFHQLTLTAAKRGLARLRHGRPRMLDECLPKIIDALSADS